MIEHGWGGGVRKHINDLAALLAEEGVPSFRGVADHQEGVLRLSVIAGTDGADLPSPGLQDAAALAEAFSALQLSRIHIHSLVGHPLTCFRPLAEAVERSGAAQYFTCHDYSAACPRINMVDWGGVYCDNRSEDHCRVCLKEPGVRFGDVDIEAWRQTYREMLQRSRRVFTPDPDVAERLQRYIPGLNTWRVRPHPASPPVARAASPAPPPRASVRTVALVGAIGPEKGSGVLVRLAGDALERDLPIRYKLFGYTDRRELAGFPNVEVTGRYADSEIDELVTSASPDFIFFPAVAPETFCYALDVAFRTGTFPVSFDLGAPARRIREAGFGATLPLSLAHDPYELNNALLGVRTDAGGWRPGTGFGIERRWTSAAAYYDAGGD